MPMTIVTVSATTAHFYNEISAQQQYRSTFTADGRWQQQQATSKLPASYQEAISKQDWSASHLIYQVVVVILLQVAVSGVPKNDVV